MKRAAAFLLFSALLARADDIDDRLRTAQALLEADDPASRDKGEAELAAVAAEAGDRLKPLLEHPDAEVRARVMQVLDRAEIIPEEGKTERLRELFKGLAEAGEADEARRKLVRDILEFHPRSASFVARELAEGRFTWVANATRIVPLGRVSVEFEATNEGACAAWVRPGRWYVARRLKPFGERPGRMSFGSGAAGAVLSLLNAARSPEDSMILALASMVRIPPNGRQVVTSSATQEGRCGTLDLRPQAMGYAPRRFEVAFGQALVALPEAEPEFGHQVIRIVLGESTGKRFSAVAWKSDASMGLDVTALEDSPEMKLDGYDPFWWVALDEKGAFMDEGAFSTDKADLAAWKKDEVRKVKIRFTPPAGTKTLWMGFSSKLDECVPAPIELK
jgi:hypothetical protein